MLNDGIEQATARKIAETAGFSYATIYNYFTNPNQLLWYVTMDLIDEMAVMIEKETKSFLNNRKKLIS